MLNHTIRISTFILISILITLFTPQVKGTETEIKKTINLNISSRSDNNRHYYITLIKQALLADGYHVNINYIGQLTANRQNKYLYENQISVIWRLQTPARDKQFLRVNVGLTNGLIAQRVLLIRPQSQKTFNSINNKSDLIEQNLTAAFGENWFDSEIWRHNKLDYVEFLGDSQKIFSMLASGRRKIDYFSRGVNEVLGEAKQHPDLTIEKNLLICYQNDSYFYVKKDNIALKKILEQALIKAKESGLYDKLLAQYWGDLNTQLNLDSRRKVILEMP